MYPYNKAMVWIRRNAQGDITDVFESNPDRYYKVVDTAVKIDSGQSENVKVIKRGGS